MKISLEQRLENLKAATTAVLPTDLVAEAGRKVLLIDWIRMLEHEAGSRLGEDVEEVHDMRVAIRRMRSLFRLLRPYFADRDVRRYNADLRQTGWALGAVRDLDVLLEHLRAFQTTQEAEQQAALQEVIDDLEVRRDAARVQLNAHLDSKAYRRFVKAFSAFLLKSADPLVLDSELVLPVEIRHVLPVLIHERLAAVRAYDSILEQAPPLTLHALRIEFKRLRYTLTLFAGILGETSAEVISEIKQLQDCLGHMNDVTNARLQLEAYLDTSHSDALAPYFAHLEAQEAEQKGHLGTLWTRFNSRKVQQKLATAILTLR